MYFSDAYHAISFYKTNSPVRLNRLNLLDLDERSNRNVDAADVYGAIVICLKNLYLLHNAEENGIFKIYHMQEQRFSAEQIAAMHSCSVRKVYKLLRKMRDALEEELERHDLMYPDEQRTTSKTVH